MPTKPESPAAAAARSEALRWADLADDLETSGLADVWFERIVIPQFDPSADLARRVRPWSHQLPSHGLADLCRFAAGLAIAEAHGWAGLDAVAATRAHEGRRFFLADRVVHWAVPLLLSAERTDLAKVMLDMADQMRLATIEASGEGLHQPGHDPYGPAREPTNLADRLQTLWGGWFWIGLDADTGAITYGDIARRWSSLAVAHPGSAALWLALSHRARETSQISPRS